MLPALQLCVASLSAGVAKAKEIPAKLLGYRPYMTSTGNVCTADAVSCICGA